MKCFVRLPLMKTMWQVKIFFKMARMLAEHLCDSLLNYRLHNLNCQWNFFVIIGWWHYLHFDLFHTVWISHSLCSYCMSTAGHEISQKSKSLLFIQSGRHVTAGNLRNAWYFMILHDMILQSDCSAVQQFAINCKTQVLHGVEAGWGQNQTVVRYKQTSPGVQARNLRSNCGTNAC